MAEEGPEEGPVNQGERVDIVVNWSEVNARRAARMGTHPSPLPYNFKAIGEDGNQQFVEYGYSHTAIAKDWRFPTEIIATYVRRPPPNPLYWSGEMKSMVKGPNDLINPLITPPTREEKRAAKAAKAAERARFTGLDENAKAAEKEEKLMAENEEKRAMARKHLAVRVARYSIGGGVAFPHLPDSLEPGIVTAANMLVSHVIPDAEAFTADELLTWVFNDIPLGPAKGPNYLWYMEDIASYKKTTKDVIELIVREEGTRFADRGDAGMATYDLERAELLSQVVKSGPFKEVDGMWVQHPDLEDLVPYLPAERKSPMVTMHEGTKVELDGLGATLYFLTYSTLTFATKKFGTLLEDRKRPNLHPERARGIDRRDKLQKFFQAISAAELKKGVRAVDLAEGTKPEMVKALIDYFAAKRTRRANTVLPAGLAAGGAVPEEEQEEQEAAL